MRLLLRRLGTRGVAPARLAPFHSYLFHLRTALKQLRRVEGATVYRGVGLAVSPALYQPGSCVLWQAFSSTSQSIAVSTDFCRSAPAHGNHWGQGFFLNFGPTRGGVG